MRLGGVMRTSIDVLRGLGQEGGRVIPHPRMEMRPYTCKTIFNFLKGFQDMPTGYIPAKGIGRSGAPQDGRSGQPEKIPDNERTRQGWGVLATQVPARARTPTPSSIVCGFCTQPWEGTLVWGKMQSQRSESEGMIQSASRTCFPTLPDHLLAVAEHSLASVIYHYDELKQRLDRHHPIWSSQLIVSDEFV
eukprot:765181-Hanusia_phi.AAC.1